MGAAVEQPVQPAVGIAGEDQPAQAQPGRDEVVRFRQLALVGEIDPGAPEDPLHLGNEDVGIGVERAMDPMGLYQSVEIVHGVTCGLYSTNENLRTSPAQSTRRTILYLTLMAKPSPSAAST